MQGPDLKEQRLATVVDGDAREGAQAIHADEERGCVAEPPQGENGQVGNDDGRAGQGQPGQPDRINQDDPTED